MERLIFDDESEIVKDDYTQLFYTNLSLRPSCGKCQFSQMRRCGDFTVGDFWGVEKCFPEFDDNKGVSLLFLNTNRAITIYNDIKQSIETIQISEEQANQQRNLSAATSIPKCRNWFWKDYKEKGLIYCLRFWSPNGGIVFKVKRKILRVINKWE